MMIAKAIDPHQVVLSNKKLLEKSGELTQYGDIIGQSKEMQEIYRLIDAVADSTANIVISGESGTGKELIAKAIHKKGSRVEEPFVAVNCSAFPNEILENELFGHEEGAFTGAIKKKAGCFELANHGTLFLDEICDMPLGAQAKILRVLEERCFRRLGGKKEIAIDVRVICASNKNLEEAVAEKKLREDLFYRLHVIEIEVPPLRKRTDDLALLMVDFLNKFSKKNGKSIRCFSTGAEEVLRNYNWPGNVRELKNTIERAVVLSHGDAILVEHLPKRIKNSENNKNEFKMPVGSKLEDVERELIFHTLQHTNNNKTRAAQVLGISLKTLHNKLNLYQSQGFWGVNST